MGEATIEMLDRWEQSGAVWRVRSITPSEVVVELCTCYGEPVDEVRSTDAAVVRYLTDQPTSNRA